MSIETNISNTPNPKVLFARICFKDPLQVIIRPQIPMRSPSNFDFVSFSLRKGTANRDTNNEFELNITAVILALDRKIPYCDKVMLQATKRKLRMINCKTNFPVNLNSRFLISEIPNGKRTSPPIRKR